MNQALEEGALLGRWKVVTLLAKGGMAEVYEVEDVQLGARYALKLFTYERGEQEAVRKRFFAEGRLLAKLCHPRLVRVYDIGEDKASGRPYFVMDLVLDQDFTVLTHSDRSEIGKNYQEESGTFGAVLAEKLRSTDESYFSLEHGMSDYIVYRVPVANDWICVSVFDTTSVFRQMKRTLLFTIFAACLVVAVILLIMHLLSRETQIAQQLESDIQEKDDQIKKISLDTYRDPLTGVKNKAALQKFSEELSRKLKEGRGEPFSILMMDVNNLKYINDNFGHDAGDEYLRGCCMTLCHIYQHSPVFRIGGDEFVAVSQNDDYENREALFIKLSEAFDQAYSMEDADAWERYSASFGTADLKPSDSSLDQVLKRADQQMYEEKKAFKEKHGSYR